MPGAKPFLFQHLKAAQPPSGRGDDWVTIRAYDIHRKLQFPDFASAHVSPPFTASGATSVPRQTSLVLEVWCDGGKAVELSFGRVAGVANPKPITIPYITYRDTNPRVLMSGAPSSPVFTGIWFDWYRTNASEAWWANEPKATADSAEINGGMRYHQKTDGQRNSLCERIFITSSPMYEEALPTIRNPPSLRQEEGKSVVWTVTSPRTFQSDHER